MADSENQSEDKIMKKSLGVSAAIAVVFGSLLPGRAAACDNVFVRSMNGAPSAVTEGLTMNSTPADSLGFSLSSSGSRIDALPVGPNSPNPLNLGAQISMGTLQATCSAAVTNNNVSGQCSGIVDPKYALTISYVPGNTSTDPSCKHDNGNHIGEDLHKLGLVVGKDVPYHAGKLDSNGQPLCKNHGKQTGGASQPASLSCQFVLVPSF